MTKANYYRIINDLARTSQSYQQAVFSTSGVLQVAVMDKGIKPADMAKLTKYRTKVVKNLHF